jgi:Carboxypeptidase regulatory-like domain
MEAQFRLNKLQLFALLAMLFAATFAIAQVSKGSISGAVVDPTGAVVSGAQVSAISQQTAQVASTTSDDSGSFRLNLLPVGTYNLEVTKSGFRKSVLRGVAVAASVDSNLGGVKLELGVATETLEVSAAPPLVQSAEAQVSATFSSTYLANIPGVQENQGLDNLAILLPGVSSSRDLSFSNTNGVGFTVNGLRGRNNDQQVDGQNNNDNSVGGPSVFVGDAEFVDSYQVTTNNFGPEYGRNSGSVINVLTKQGTNTWHGSIFGTESNSFFNTLDSTQKRFQGLTQVPHFNDSFFGATIGGPWVKNKVFFFAGYDTEINSSKTTYSTGNLFPTPLGLGQVAGCYTNPNSLAALAALNAFGPYGIGGGNPQPSGTPAPVTLTSPDVPNGTITDPDTGEVIPVCNVDMAGVQRTLSNSNHQYDWMSRLDVTGTHDTVYGRYVWQKLSFFNQDSFGTAAAGYPVNVPSTGQGVVIDWTHKLSDRMVNDLRLSYGRIKVQFGTNGIGNTIPGIGQIGDAVARIQLTGSNLGDFGPATNAPQGRIVNTYQVQDNWNYVRGRHQLKAGVNYTYQRSPNIFLPNLNGNYQFSNWTNYALNKPTRVLITLGNPSLDFREHDSFFYFGDDWKVTNHLTLNLGLTYSYYGQPANLFHNNDAKQQASSTPFWDPSLPASVTTFPSIPAPKSSWGPSVGFAYSPGWGGWLFGQDKTVFRGGYRLSYDPPFYNIYLNIASSAPQVLAQTIQDPVTKLSPVPMPANPVGPNVRADLAPFLTLGVSDPRSFSQSTVTPNFGPDRVHSWSFGIQRELGQHAALEARYVGNHGQNLFQSINGNPFIADIAQGIADGVFPASLLPSGLTPCPEESAVVASAVGRANCDLGIVRQRTNTAYSDYNGLQTEFRTNNLFNQLTMKTNYTFAKTTDNASEIFGTFAGGGTYAFSQNPLDFKKAEHGLSGLDFRHTWTFSFYEDLPMFHSQHGIVGHLLGGWAVAGSYIVQSGQNFTPAQLVISQFTSPFNSVDFSFLGSFNSGVETARPFLSNPSAPVNAIGMFAADACNFFGACTTAETSPDTLLSFNALNTTGDETTVDSNAVHFIANGGEANAIFGTPFGNAGRNTLRSAKVNTGNFQLSKVTRLGERTSVTVHMSMVNVFNHPNFGYTGPGCITCVTTDPFIEDAGGTTQNTGFADPTVLDGGHRSIRFGIKVKF